MDRRSQLAAWVVLLLLGAGAAYVATVVRPFPEEPSTWPLRARYAIERPGAGTERVVHEFEGTGWRNWVDVRLPAEPGGEAVVTRFDGRDASGVLASVASDEPFAALEAVDAVRWKSVEAVHDQRRAPNEWFSLRFGEPPDPLPERELGDGDEALRDRVAEDLALDPAELRAAAYTQAACPEQTVALCGDAVHRYRYVFHAEGQVPLFVEERHGTEGVTTRLVVTDLDVNLAEGTALVAQ